MNAEEIRELIQAEGVFHAFTHSELACRILRPDWTGDTFDQIGKSKNLQFNWCGYVSIPATHKLYEIDHWDIEIAIEVHGGLTYSRSDLYFQPEKNVWWFGFDCGHMHDISRLEGSHADDAVYRDKNYVIQECKNLAEQLKKME